MVQLTIDVTQDELELITKVCWLRPLKKAYDLLGNSTQDAVDHAHYEIVPLYKTEQIRNKLVDAYFKSQRK